jgi:hypothetical protein
MTQPLPSERILPNGRTGYLNPYTGRYSASRSYAQRMQRNYARGMTQSEARGHRPNILTGETESQRRRRLTLQNTGMTPSQYYQYNWQQRYPLMPLSWWRRMSPLIQEINRRTSPGLEITPEVVYSQIVNAPITGHDLSWVENRLAFRLAAIQEYQDYGSNNTGYQLYVENQLDTNPPEWWYYH